MKNDNLAYDLKMFEDKTTEQHQHIKKIPKSKNVKKTTNGIGLVFFIIFGFVICFTMLFLRVQINETNSKIQKQMKILNELKSEEVRLKVSIESNTSLNNVERIAKEELGLNKLETSQIEYVNIEKDNSNIVINNKTSLWDKIKNFFQNIFS